MNELILIDLAKYAAGALCLGAFVVVLVGLFILAVDEEEN